MKPCPVCGGGPGVVDDVGCRKCQIFAPPDTWALMPRVAPNAEALVDALVEAVLHHWWMEERDARAELLRACVVDAAEVAEMRKERDEQARAVAASMEAIEGLRAYAARLTMERDEAVAALASIQEMEAEAERISEETPAPEWAGRVADKMVAHVMNILGAQPATGVPEAELTNAEQCARREDNELRALGATPAAPPADDADALLDALVNELVLAVQDWDEYNGDVCLARQRAAEAAVRARMRPEVTAEALWAEMGFESSFAGVWFDKLRAAFAALGGGK